MFNWIKKIYKKAPKLLTEELNLKWDAYVLRKKNNVYKWLCFN
jgi:hypothetical protein